MEAGVLLQIVAPVQQVGLEITVEQVFLTIIIIHMLSMNGDTSYS